jgi:hypothetical protein
MSCLIQSVFFIYSTRSSSSYNVRNSKWHLLLRCPLSCTAPKLLLEILLSDRPSALWSDFVSVEVSEGYAALGVWCIIYCANWNRYDLKCFLRKHPALRIHISPPYKRCALQWTGNSPIILLLYAQVFTPHELPAVLDVYIKNHLHNQRTNSMELSHLWEATNCSSSQEVLCCL